VSVGIAAGRRFVTGGIVSRKPNSKAQQELRAQEKLAQRQRDDDLRAIMATQQGRRFVMDIIDRRCNAHGTGLSWSGSEMYHNAGQRSVGVDLRTDCERVATEQYVEMLTEFFEARKRLKELRDAAGQRAANEMDEQEDDDGL
jgi:hypothetical protein